MGVATTCGWVCVYLWVGVTLLLSADLQSTEVVLLRLVQAER